MLAEFKTYLANRMERSMKDVAAMNQARAVCAERGFTGGWSTGMRIPATLGLCANKNVPRSYIYMHTYLCGMWHQARGHLHSLSPWSTLSRFWCHQSRSS